MIFAKKISLAIREKRNSICLGIDPHPTFWPQAFGPLLYPSHEKRVSDWGHSIIEIAAGKVPAVKFQSAFFEAFGGSQLLKTLIKYAKKNDLLVILDGKRGDIASTMTAYGEAAFAYYCADALTIAPYMGFDVLRALKPWLTQGFGAYVLWLTSNISAKKIQDAPMQSGEPLSNHIFESFLDSSDKEQMHGTWGFVLGANKINDIPNKIWDKCKTTPLLLPGIGAQGADSNNPRIKEIAHQDHVLFPMSRSLTGVGLKDRDSDWNRSANIELYKKTFLSNLDSMTRMFQF